MTTEQTEKDLLQLIVPQLEAEGYDVYLQPSRSIRPSFLGDYRPDAIALRADGNLIIETVGSSQSSSKRVGDISDLVKKNPGWTLRVFYVRSLSEADELSVQAKESILTRVAEIRRLIVGKHTEAALLLSWATFEAIARSKHPSRYRKPQTPGRIIETLASSGEITPTQANFLRTLAEKRTRLIHGQLGVSAAQPELEQFVAILIGLLAEKPTDEV